MTSTQCFRQLQPARFDVDRDDRVTPGEPRRHYRAQAYGSSTEYRDGRAGPRVQRINHRPCSGLHVATERSENRERNVVIDLDRISLCCESVGCK